MSENEAEKLYPSQVSKENNDCDQQSFALNRKNYGSEIIFQ